MEIEKDYKDVIIGIPGTGQSAASFIKALGLDHPDMQERINTGTLQIIVPDGIGTIEHTEREAILKDKKETRLSGITNTIETYRDIALGYRESDQLAQQAYITSELAKNPRPTRTEVTLGQSRGAAGGMIGRIVAESEASKYENDLEPTPAPPLKKIYMPIDPVAGEPKRNELLGAEQNENDPKMLEGHLRTLAEKYGKKYEDYIEVIFNEARVERRIGTFDLDKNWRNFTEHNPDIVEHHKVGMAHSSTVISRDEISPELETAFQKAYDAAEVLTPVEWAKLTIKATVGLADRSEAKKQGEATRKREHDIALAASENLRKFDPSHPIKSLEKSEEFKLFETLVNGMQGPTDKILSPVPLEQIIQMHLSNFVPNFNNRGVITSGSESNNSSPRNDKSSDKSDTLNTSPNKTITKKKQKKANVKLRLPLKKF